MFKSKQIQAFFISYSIRFDPFASNTQSQNSSTERLKGIIKEKARAIRIGTKLLTFLWPKIT